MFKLTLKTENAAFCDSDFPDQDAAARGCEVARILREVAGKVEDGLPEGAGGNIRDANGNKVGEWTWKE